MRNNKGFTLIELVAVIVILGILAVTAVPQFLDLRTDARNAAAAGVAGAIASGAANNYSKGLVNGVAGGASTITGCDGSQFANVVIGSTGGTSVLTVNGVGFDLSGTGTGTALTSGSARTCHLRHQQATTGWQWQTFTIVGCASSSCG